MPVRDGAPVDVERGGHRAALIFSSYVSAGRFWYDSPAIDPLYSILPPSEPWRGTRTTGWSDTAGGESWQA